MNIIQITYSLCTGGAEKFIVDLSNALATQGHHVMICMLLQETDENLFNKQFLNNHVSFHSMNFSKGFSFKKAFALCKFLDECKPDVVHCHLNVIPYIFPLALFNRNIKFFHTLHNTAPNASGARYQKYINKFFYKYNLIRPICISNLCYESFKDFYSLSNACMINNGRACLEYSSEYLQVQQEIESYKINSQTKIFIHVARFSEQKNQNLLVDAFNVLFERHINCILLIIGRDFDTNLGLELQKKSSPNIYYLGPKDNVQDYLSFSDAFCLTSYFEGLPLSLIEAISYGVTPISTPVGGVPDVIKDSITGYLATDLSLVSYVHALYRFLQEPLKSDVLINYYKQNFSMDICARNYESYFLL